MNKTLRNISLYILALSLFFCALELRARTPRAEVLRLHVLAHSDSAFDQAVKLQVRDAILQTGGAHMRAARNGADAAALAMEDAAALLAAARAVLQAQGCTYGVRLCMGTYPFPARRYGESVYPAGDYRALRVVLGDGAGANWWCVLFPPLCILEGEAGEIEYEEDGRIRYKSLLAESLHRGGREPDEKERHARAPAAFDPASAAYVRLPGGAGRRDP